MSSEALGLAVKSMIACVDAGHAAEEVIEAMIETGWRTCKAEWMLKRKRDEAVDGAAASAQAQRVAALLNPEPESTPRVINE